MQNGCLEGKQLGLKLPEPKNFDEFFDNYLQQLGYFIKMYEYAENYASQVYNQKYKRPMVSSLIGGCIENAKFVDEGGSTYWFKSMDSSGLATAADSLAAIEDVVYRTKQKTMSEFVDILRTDFDGEELFRQYLDKRVPKYGNGDASVDGIAKKLVDAFCESVSACRTWNDTPYRPGLYSYYGPSVNYGLKTGATPDGRKAGEPLSLNTDPSHGAIRNGLTGALRSVTAYDQAKSFNACATDIHLTPNTPPEVLQSIVEYLNEHGALYIQISVVDRAELLDAQKHPEKHKDLVVRVTGFSAHFIALDKETQYEVIQRSYWSE